MEIRGEFVEALETIEPGKQWTLKFNGPNGHHANIFARQLQEYVGHHGSVITDGNGQVKVVLDLNEPQHLEFLESLQQQAVAIRR